MLFPICAEIGDLLFALVNLARWRGVDSEACLREANARFRKRFGLMEDSAAGQGRSLSDVPPDQLLAMWEEAKARSA